MYKYGIVCIIMRRPRRNIFYKLYLFLEIGKHTRVMNNAYDRGEDTIYAHFNLRREKLIKELREAL